MSRRLLLPLRSRNSQKHKHSRRNSLTHRSLPRHPEINGSLSRIWETTLRLPCQNVRTELLRSTREHVHQLEMQIIPTQQRKWIPKQHLLAIHTPKFYTIYIHRRNETENLGRCCKHNHLQKSNKRTRTHLLQIRQVYEPSQQRLRRNVLWIKSLLKWTMGSRHPSISHS